MAAVEEVLQAATAADCFDVLGLEPKLATFARPEDRLRRCTLMQQYTEADFKAALKVRQLQVHPDKNKIPGQSEAAAAFREVMRAWGQVSDESLRQTYSANLRAQAVLHLQQATAVASLRTAAPVTAEMESTTPNIMWDLFYGCRRMVRTEIWINGGDPFEQTLPWEQELSSSDKIIYALLAASFLILLLRVISAAFDAVRFTEPAAPAISEGPSVPFEPLFFGLAALGVLIKVASNFSLGLLAAKWVLAGEQVGFPLFACFCMVAANTELLVSAGLVSHLRAILVKLAIQRQVKIKFTCISHLLGSQVGKFCVIVSAASTVVLVVHLSDHPLKLATWLGSTLGLLLWVNASFKSIGLMSMEVWEEIKPIKSSSEEKSVVEFAESLSLQSGQQARSWSDMWRFKLSNEDELLLQHRLRLMQHAYPRRWWLWRIHGFMLVSFGLLNACVPTAIICYCLSQVPQLQHMEIVGGAMPDLEPGQSDYYIQLHPTWKEDVMLKFELEIGQASRYVFCDSESNCVDLQPKHSGDEVRLSAKIRLESFGTCRLTLLGLRSHTYSFTVLALRSLSIALEPSLQEQYPAYEIGRRLYSASALPPRHLQNLSLKVKFGLDGARIKMVQRAQGQGGRKAILDENLIDSNLLTDLIEPAVSPTSMIAAQMMSWILGSRRSDEKARRKFGVIQCYAFLGHNCAKLGLLRFVARAKGSQSNAMLVISVAATIRVNQGRVLLGSCAELAGETWWHAYTSWFAQQSTEEAASDCSNDLRLFEQSVTSPDIGVLVSTLLYNGSDACVVMAVQVLQSAIQHLIQATLDIHNREPQAVQIVPSRCGAVFDRRMVGPLIAQMTEERCLLHPCLLPVALQTISIISNRAGRLQEAGRRADKPRHVSIFREQHDLPCSSVRISITSSYTQYDTNVCCLVRLA
ncbi:unnamed protein product [Symbiodinium sp. CCMP2592]|nr:unnamed protein product [Symbiodinium sp. CCMP2592]